MSTKMSKSEWKKEDSLVLLLIDYMDQRQRFRDGSLDVVVAPDALANMTGLLEKLASNATIPPPVATFSDYVEMLIYSVLIVIGVPLNLATLWRVWRRYAATGARIFLLHLNLNISDLLILVFHAFYRACWLATYQWYGGTALCRLMKFLDNLGVAFSSNVIVCIGFDRLFSLNPSLTVGDRLKRVKLSLGIAWTSAIAISLPHFAIWQVTEGLPGFHQCMSVFKLNSVPITQYLASNQTRKEIDDWNVFLERMEFTWSLVNILVNFWIPAVLIIICYFIILRQVYDKLGNDGKDVQVIRYPTHMDRKQRDNWKQERLAEVSIHTNPSHSKSTSSSRHSQHNAVVLGSTYVPPKRRGSSLTYTTTVQGLQQQRDSRTDVNGYAQFSEENTARLLRIRRRKYKTLLLTLALVSAYVLCWLPYNSLMIWQIGHVASYKLFEDRLYFLYGLIVFNSLINPLIYGHIGAGSRRRCLRIPCTIRISRRS